MVNFQLCQTSDAQINTKLRQHGNRALLTFEFFLQSFAASDAAYAHDAHDLGDDYVLNVVLEKDQNQQDLYITFTVTQPDGDVVTVPWRMLDAPPPTVH